jgi:hypothetical protein
MHWRITSTSLQIIARCHTLKRLRRASVMLRSVSEVVLVQQQAGGVRCTGLLCVLRVVVLRVEQML